MLIIYLKTNWNKTNSKYIVGFLDVIRPLVLNVLKHLKRKLTH